MGKGAEKVLAAGLEGEVVSGPPDGLSSDSLSLSPSSVLMKDLISDPPNGFPALNPRQQEYLRERVRNPLLSLSEVKRRIGVRPDDGHLDRSPKIARYLDAIARHTAEQHGDPSRLRQQAVARLAGVVAEGLDRDAVLATKVLMDLLPPVSNEVKELSGLSDQDLVARLDAVLSSLRSLGVQGLPDLSALREEVTALSPVPTAGTGAGDQADPDRAKSLQLKRIAPPPASDWTTGTPGAGPRPPKTV